MKDLTDRLGKLSPEKRALLQSMLLKKSGDTSDPQAIPRRNRADHLPLSFAQGRLWFLERLAPDQVLYNLSSSLRLTGHLDLPLLERCLNEIIRRHEILRTSFMEENGEPVQVIAPSGTIHIVPSDLTGLPEAEQRDQVRRLAADAARRPFDLEKGPLLRPDLLRLEDTDHVLVLTMHHMISDGWSMGVMIREIRSLYESFSAGTPSPLPELDIQYADFALWQREWMKGPEPAAQIDYWTKRLAGAPPVLNLPLDRPRPPRQTHHGGAEPLDIGPDLVRDLDEIARKAGATRFMILLAAYTVLLHRYCNQEDILVGTPVAGRNLRDIEPLIGFFVNTLVIRTDLSVDLTFRNLLDQIRRTSVAAFEHQDLPFEKLVDALQPERTLSHSPVFQTMFVLHNAHAEALDLPGLTIRPMEAETVSAQFDLVLSVLEVESGFHLRFEYNTDLFDPATIRRMADNFEVLLTGIAAHPESKVSELPILTARERRRLLVEFNDTAAEYPDDKSIVDLFEAQVEQPPDAPAVVFEDRQLSYRDLNRAANRVAHFLLKECEIRQEDRIGVFLERSERPTVAMLGVMKAGGAYLPLDPSYPEDRLRYMIEDSGCSVLLTESGTKDALRELSDSVRLVDVRELPESETGNPRLATGPNHLAYVIYTSGSTGRPKGVMVEHGGFANMALSQIRHLGIQEKDRILQFASISFDGSLYETFITLLSGACLVKLKEEQVKDPEELIQVLFSDRVSVAALPPSYLQLIGFEKLRCLQILITAGETAVPENRSFIDDQHYYWNLYGPTEASVTATSFSVPQGSEKEPIPIGEPISNLQIDILHPSSLQLQPIGAVGEIMISGAGLARGYLNRPDLTKERFLPHPFRDKRRMYRTGDLGRWRQDRQIEFLGRIDHQVKIRGYRIELGEIEARLRKHSSVFEATVHLSEQQGNQEIVAYFVGNEELTIHDLRIHLRKDLPDYMIPAHFIRLKDIPRLPNQKVDKNRLPEPTYSRTAPDKTYTPPETASEKDVVSVWMDLLGKEPIGIHDNYFSLGGDSLKAIQMASRLRQKGWRMQIKDIYSYPTAAQLATRLTKHVEAAYSPEKMSGSPLLTPVQHWFFEKITTDRHHFNQGVLLAGLPRFEEKALERAFQAIWSHYDVFHLVFRRKGDKYIPEYVKPTRPFHIEVVDLQNYRCARAKLEAHAGAAQSGMNLEEGPLLRVVLYRMEDSDRLLISAHHLIVDAFSIRILLEDFSNAYQQAVHASTITLPPPTSSFGLWSQKVHQYVYEDGLDQETEYWRRVAMIHQVPLPSSLRDGQNLEREGGFLSTTLTESETEMLLTRIESGRIEGILLTALAMAIEVWTGDREAVVMVAGHGREAELIGVDVNRTIGWFSAMYPVPLSLSDSADECRHLKKTYQILQNIPHRGLGYSLLRYIRKDPVLTDASWPEIVFNYVGQIDQDVESRWFSIAKENIGPLRSPTQKRPHVLEMSALVIGGCMMTALLFDGSRFTESSMERFLGHYQSALQTLIRNCLHLPAV